jgi:hypothetical protein
VGLKNLRGVALLKVAILAMLKIFLNIFVGWFVKFNEGDRIRNKSEWELKKLRLKKVK